MDKAKTRRNMLRLTLLAAASATLTGCHVLFRVPPGHAKKLVKPAKVIKVK